MGGIWHMKWICEAAKSLDVFPLAGSIALRLGQRHRDSIFSTCANCKRVACVLWFKQARSKFHLWWLVITCNEWLFLDHPNPSLRMSKIILPGGNSQVWKRLEAQISASSKTLSSHVREWPNFFKCEVRRAPFLVCNPSLDAISNVQVASVSWERLHWKPDHKLHIYKHVLANIHESPWHMIPIPAALVCPKTCDTVAEDACNIASHLSINPTCDKWGILR